MIEGDDDLHRTETEETLAGGNMAAVVRVGDTVRRSAGPWTPQVHRLLAHLRAQGITEAPAPLGFDAQGREILTFTPGAVGHFPFTPTRSDAALAAAARLLRRMHDATADVAPLWPEGWQASVRPPVEVICHGDFAPYNLVFDGEMLVGVIDFDHAHPGSRTWDIAYAIYRMAPLMDPSNPESFGSPAEQGRRLRLFCDAYGLSERAPLLPAIGARIAAMADYLREGAARGDGRMQANIDAGHLAIYTTDLAYFETQRAAWEVACA